MLHSSVASNGRIRLLPPLSTWRGRGGLGKQQLVKGKRASKGAAMMCEEADDLVDEKVGFELEVAESPPFMEWPKPLSPLAGEQAKAVELERAFKAEAIMASQPAFGPSDIIYQDEWLFVINKPSGIYSGHVLSTVSSMLASRELDTAGLTSGSTGAPPVHQLHLHMANRLDRDTSGIMIVTKCKKVAGKLTRMFQSQKMKKSYVALCIGPRPAWDKAYVETGHGRSRWGAWRVYACEDVGRKLPEKSSVKSMSTLFSVLSVNGERVRDGCCNEVCEKMMAKRDQFYQNVPAFGDEVLIRVEPLTGRTHQIRLHCQFLGLPLRGDIKYGGPLVWQGINYDTHALHAESMSFRHPVTDTHLSLVAPLPVWATC